MILDNLSKSTTKKYTKKKCFLQRLGQNNKLIRIRTCN